MSCCSDGFIIKCQEYYKRFEVYAVTINIFMTEYHHLLTLQSFHFFESPSNDAFEVQFFSGLHFDTMSQAMIALRF